MVIFVSILSCTATQVPTRRQMARNRPRAPALWRLFADTRTRAETLCLLEPRIFRCSRHLRLPVTGWSASIKPSHNHSSLRDASHVRDFMGFPHLFSSPNSVLSCSHSSACVSLAVGAHVHAGFVPLSINTLGSFPVTVADSSTRKASSGGVPADNPCSLPMLICFATGLDLTFMSWLFLEALFHGSFLVHVHLPVPLHLQHALSSPLATPVLDRQCHASFRLEKLFGAMSFSTTCSNLTRFPLNVQLELLLLFWCLFVPTIVFFAN